MSVLTCSCNITALNKFFCYSNLYARRAPSHNRFCIKHSFAVIMKPSAALVQSCPPLFVAEAEKEARNRRPRLNDGKQTEQKALMNFCKGWVVGLLVRTGVEWFFTGVGNHNPKKIDSTLRRVSHKCIEYFPIPCRPSIVIQSQEWRNSTPWSAVFPREEEPDYQIIGVRSVKSFDALITDSQEGRAISVSL